MLFTVEKVEGPNGFYYEVFENVPNILGTVVYTRCICECFDRQVADLLVNALESYLD